MSGLTDGELRHPFTNENIPPPIARIAKAPPQSSTIRYGLKIKSKVRDIQLIRALFRHISFLASARIGMN